MAEMLTVMNDDEARSKIESSILSESEKRLYRFFVERFAGSRFFANTPEFVESFQEDEKVGLPNWATEHLTILSGAFPAEGSLHFAFSSFAKDTFSPIEDELDQLWFSLDYIGWPSDRREQKVLKQAGKNISLFPIGSELVDDGYQLAINVTGEDDTAIYQYHLASLMSNESNKEEVMSNVYRIFTSPGEMLSKIGAIKHGSVVTRSAEG